MNYDGLDPARLVQEYVTHSEHLEKLSDTVKSIKDHLSNLVDKDGEEDEKGHRYLKVGPYLLKRQRRQSTPTLDANEVEEWAKERGIWEQISKSVVVLDEDALVAYVYDHRDEEGLESTFQSFYKQAKPSYAFMKPVEEATYDY